MIMPKGIYKRKPKKDFISKDELLKLYIGEDLSANKIAYKLNVSKQTILYWLDKHNIPRRCSSYYTKGKTSHRYGFRKAVIPNDVLSKLYNTMSLEQISKKYNVGLETIRRYMIMTGLNRRPQGIVLKIQRGKDNPNWMGGISFEPYGLEFNSKLKEQIRARDDHTCQECGQTQEQAGYKLAVHHIDYNKKNNKPENLIILCRQCHSQTNYERDDWTNYFKNKMEVII